MKGRVRKIRLENDLSYREKVLGFNDLLLGMLTAPTGTDGFIRYRIVFRDGTYGLERLESGISTPLRSTLQDENEKGRNLVIPSGTYYFEEYPDLSEEEILKDTLSTLLGIIGKDEIIVRLYKKNSLECVLQGMRPV